MCALCLPDTSAERSAQESLDQVSPSSFISTKTGVLMKQAHTVPFTFRFGYFCANFRGIYISVCSAMCNTHNAI